MKNTLLSLLGAALSILGSCQSTKTEQAAAAFGTCPATTKVVRTVSDVAGTLSYDQPTHEYRITVSQPGTVDVVDVGVVCGTLPARWQGDVRKVVFSGTYKEFANAPSAPAGYTTYHLELTKLAAK